MLNVGDCVVVKAYSEINCNEPPFFTESMKRYCGMSAKVTQITHCGNYKISISEFTFREEWLVPSENDCKSSIIKVCGAHQYLENIYTVYKRSERLI